jgi:hypothetical protein
LPFIDMQFIVIRQPKWGSTVTDQNARPLRAAERVLRVLLGLNVVYGIGIVVLLVASFLAPEWIAAGLGVPPTMAMITGMRLIMGIGILGAGISYYGLIRLQDIVATVGGGDPFVIQNAVRVRQLAWAVLWLQLLHLCVGMVRAGVSAAGVRLDMDWSFSLAPWLAVLFLFVLAKVFEHGAWMRDELEATI